MLIEKRVLHVSDVASLLGCSSQVVYKLIDTGELKAYKAGRAWKIDAQSVLDYIAARLKDKTCV